MVFRNVHEVRSTRSHSSDRWIDRKSRDLAISFQRRLSADVFSLSQKRGKILLWMKRNYWIRATSAKKTHRGRRTIRDRSSMAKSSTKTFPRESSLRRNLVLLIGAILRFLSQPSSIRRIRILQRYLRRMGGKDTDYSLVPRQRSTVRRTRANE